MNFKTKLSIIFKYGNLKRIRNFLLTKFSKRLKLTKVKGNPITLMLEPTNFCNLKCPLCPTGQGLIKRKKESLSFEKAKIILNQLGPEIIHLRLWNWGEPFLDKDFFKIVKYAKKYNLFVNTSTNAFFLTREIAKKIVDSELDELIISLDGASEESYKKYRKQGSFEKVLNSIKEINYQKKLQNKKFPKIKLQFIIMKHNQHEIKDIIKIAKKIEVNKLFFKSVGIMDSEVKENVRKYIPTKEQFIRKSFEKIENKCDYLWEEITINVDGSVVPCCRDSNNRYLFGNIFKENFKQVWNNKKYQNFRKKVLQNKKQIEICKFCSGDKKELSIKEITFN
jgi:radical SAM protein with 4Fe4S-binding SPASM domain